MSSHKNWIPESYLEKQGTISDMIHGSTEEPDHPAELRFVLYLAQEYYHCSFLVHDQESNERWKGLCLIPQNEMDENVAAKFLQTEDQLSFISVHRSERFESLEGYCRLGGVINYPNAAGDTYTCKAFFSFGTEDESFLWGAHVTVPKRHVPEYKLIDPEGELNAVQSIESPQDAKSDGECIKTVVFHGGEDAPCRMVTVFDDDGESFEGLEMRIVQKRNIGEDRLEAEFKVRVPVAPGSTIAPWVLFWGDIHRKLKHGRFYTSDWHRPTSKKSPMEL